MKGISRVRDALFTASDRGFEAVVATLLEGLIEHTGRSKPLGRLDRAGIDGYVYRDEDDSLRTAIQCKGFEVFEYGAKQHAQCRKEVTKYLAKGPITHEYWLVINRAITDRKMRAELIADLDILVAAGKAHHAELFDMAPFLTKLKELASERLTAWAEARRTELFQFYADGLEFVDYIRPVPFRSGKLFCDPVERMFTDALSFFDELPKSQTGKFRPAPKYLLTSSFGFGKTSTLHALAREWINSGKHLIYVPASFLDDKAFSNASGLANSLLRILLPDDVVLHDLVRRLVRDSLKQTLATSSDWLLLIDGLDESPWAFKPNSLSALWGCIRDLGLVAALSAREELVNSRPTEFGADASRVPFERLELLDWSDDLILQFLDRFALRQVGGAPQSFQELRQLCSAGQYMDVYGDIPRRPLFLGMLAADAWAGREPVRELHRLYGQYFRQKFLLDRSGAASGGLTKRPSSVVDAFGIDEALERLMRIMGGAAAYMIAPNKLAADRSPSEFLVQTDTIQEDDLKRIAAETGVEFLQFEELIMHSLLQPAGRDRITRARLSKFAHRSYQDWFLARHIALNGVGNLASPPEAVKRFLAPMILDLKRDRGLP